MKSIHLIELMLLDKDSSSNDLQLTLYGKVNYSAFNKLVNRLKDKVHEILIFDSNLINSGNYGKRNQTVFEIRKRLLQSEVMFVRGMNDEVANFQNKIISLAKQYEIYDGLIEALAAKQRYLGFRVGSNANYKIKNEIDYYEQSRHAYNRALDIYNSMAAKINFSSSYLEYKTELDDALTLLNKDYEQSKSAHVGYHYFLLLTEYYQNNSDFKNAQNTLTKLKELVEGNVSIYTKHRFGAALINIANNDLLMYNFDQCVLHARDAIQYFTDSAINTGVAREIEFYALFYLNKMEEAEKLIEELYHSSRSSKTPFLYSKRAYLLAYMKTLKREFSQSNNLLAEVKDIEKDKEGWNIGKRILLIINRIEAKEFESVDLHVQNLQKHIQRTLKTKYVRKRDILILRILLKLINEQFDFEKVYTSRKRYFDLLESNDSEYCWKIKSPELIRFHEWFKCKMDAFPYSHLSAMEKEIEKNFKSH